MKKVTYIISIMLMIALIIVSTQAVNFKNDIEPLASTASITLYFKSDTGAPKSGIVRIYFQDGRSSDYTIPTQGKKLSGFSSGTIYGFNLIVDGYAQLSYEFAPSSTADYSETFIFYPYSYYPDFEPPLTSYTAPSASQNQHFGYRNNNGQDFHTGVDFASDANGTRFDDMVTAPTIDSVCSGIIYTRTFIRGGGNVVQVKYEDTNEDYFVSYLHLASFSCGALESNISQGDDIGVIGATLNSDTTDDPTMPKHLHLSVSTCSSISKIPGYFLDPIAFAVYEE